MESGGTRSRRSRQARKPKTSGSYEARPKKRLCRHSLCCLVTWVAVFVVLQLFWFLANINVKLISAANSIFGTSSTLTDSLHSKVSQLRGGLPSRSAFIVINLAKRRIAGLVSHGSFAKKI